jgi:hypothetical protein
MKTEITLGGIGYFMEVKDGQVVFTESRPIAGLPVTEFAYERPRDINETPGIWHLTWLEMGTRGCVASHLEQALQYCRAKFGGDFADYKGSLATAKS